jgi:DNA invertase Pin-like site-specific DNA recombinase
VSILTVYHNDNTCYEGILTLNNDVNNLITLCRPCHSRHHNVTVDRHDVQEMVEMGMTYTQTGKILGISRQRVHQIYKSYLDSRGILIKSRIKRSP